MAIKRENIEIVENLLSNEKIDVNIFGIFNFFIICSISNKLIYAIFNHDFEYNF